MIEQLTIDGAAVDTAPPRVPPLFGRQKVTTDRLPLKNRPLCTHCVMTEQAIIRWETEERELPAPWSQFSSGTWVVLSAMFCITQGDGSTLMLCAQHATDHADHTNRRDQDG